MFIPDALSGLQVNLINYYIFVSSLLSTFSFADAIQISATGVESDTGKQACLETITANTASLDASTI